MKKLAFIFWVGILLRPTETAFDMGVRVESRISEINDTAVHVEASKERAKDLKNGYVNYRIAQFKGFIQADEALQRIRIKMMPEQLQEAEQTFRAMSAREIEDYRYNPFDTGIRYENKAEGNNSLAVESRIKRDRKEAYKDAYESYLIAQRKQDARAETALARIRPYLEPREVQQKEQYIAQKDPREIERCYK